MFSSIQGQIDNHTSQINSQLIKKLQGRSLESLSAEERTGIENYKKYLTDTDQYDALMDIQKQLRPQLEKNKVYDENIAMARTNLHGPDRGVQAQENLIQESSTEAIGQAQNYSSSTSALLSTLSDINKNKGRSLRELGAENAGLRQQKLGTLMGANVMGAEEDDKVWNYNVNQPYQTDVAETRDRRKEYIENKFDLLDTLGQIAGIAGNFIPGGGGGGMSGRSKRKNIRGGDHTSYNPFPDDGNDYGGG